MSDLWGNLGATEGTPKLASIGGFQLKPHDPWAKLAADSDDLVDWDDGKMRSEPSDPDGQPGQRKEREPVKWLESSKTAADAYEKRNGTTMDLPVFRFTMPAEDGTPEDLEIMLRDGYDAEARGTESNSGHDYVWVEYRMADETAQGWYKAYPNIGMSRRSSKTAGDNWIKQNADVQMLNGENGEYAWVVRAAGGSDWIVNNSVGICVADGQSATDVDAKAMAEYVLARRLVGDQRWASRKTAMPAPADMGVSVGDIFVNSWGYDQTNVDFYKVVRLTGAGVEVVPIGKKFVSQNGPGGNSVIPDPNNIRDFDVCTGIGTNGNGVKSKVCKLTDGYRGTPSIVLKSGQYWASKWDGAPEHETDSMFGH